MSKTKKLLAILLSLLMFVSVIPAFVFNAIAAPTAPAAPAVTDECPKCHGEKTMEVKGSDPCDTCGGTGLDVDSNPCPDCIDGYKKEVVDCDECAGTGEVSVPVSENDNYKISGLTDNTLNLTVNSENDAPVPENTFATPGETYYVSDNTTIVEVDGTKLKAKAAGEAYVYAIDKSNAAYTWFFVKVEKISADIKIDGTDSENKIKVNYGGGNDSSFVIDAVPYLDGYKDDVPYSAFTYEIVSGEDEYSVALTDNTDDKKYEIAYANVTADEEASVKVKWSFAGNDEFNKPADLTVEYVISVPEYTGSDIVLNPASANGKNGWYKSSLKMQAPAGYSISSEYPATRAAVKAMESEITVSDDGDYTGANALSVFLKDNATDTVYKATAPDAKVDATAPDAPTLSFETKNGKQEVESANYRFFQKADKFTLSSSDSQSGVDKFIINYKINDVDKSVSYNADSNGEAAVTLESFKEKLGFDTDTDINIADEVKIVDFVAVDKAGNESAHTDEEGNVWVVDNTVPGYNVSYSEGYNNVDGTYYYGKDLLDGTADVKTKVTIEEENFFASDARVKMYKSDNTAAASQSWVQDGKKFTYDIKSLSEDGRYFVKASYTPSGDENSDLEDRSGNTKENTYQSNILVIDRTAPEVKDFTFEDADTENPAKCRDDEQHIYSAAQKLVISIDEENFNPNGVVIKATAQKGESVIDVSADELQYDSTAWAQDSNGIWKNNSITISKSGTYNFTVTCTDFAGNEGANSVDGVIGDFDAPTITVDYSKSLISVILDTITFNIFEKWDDSSKAITVTAEDESTYIKSIVVSTVDMDGNENEVISEDYGDDKNDKRSVEFNSLPLNFRGYLKIVVTDTVGNYTTYTGINNAEGGKETVVKVINGDTYVQEKVTTDKLDPEGFITDNTAPEMTYANITEPALILNEDLSGTGATAVERGNILNLNNSGDSNTDVLVYDGKVELSFKVKDANVDASDYREKYPTVKDGENEISTNWTVVGDEFVSDVITIDTEGRHSLTVNYTDLSGNKMDEYKTPYFVIDETAPVITKFVIDTEGAYYYQDENKNEKTESAPADNDVNYSFYFQNDATVTVYAKDTFEGSSEAGIAVASGVSDIILVSYDVEAGVWSVVDTDKAVTHDAGDGSEVCKEFRISGNFKGNIYAVAVDRLGHCSGEGDYNNDVFGISESKIDVDKTLLTGNDNAYYVVPERTIIADIDKHVKNSDIEIAVNDDNGNKVERKRDSSINLNNLPNELRDKTPDFTLEVNGDKTNVPLFRDDVSVTITATESYAGLRKIEYFVYGRADQDAENNQSGEVVFDNSGAASSDGWDILEKDANLCTKASKNITVKNNSNDIMIVVVIEDRAGNKTYDYNVIGIDKDDPIIEITYKDDQKAHATSNYYYSRIETIKITERNFDAAEIKAAIAKKLDFEGTEAPDISNITSNSSWKVGAKEAIENDTNEKVRTYTYKIPYTVDGKYKFSIELYDCAGNRSSKNEKLFHIDTHAPTINVKVTSRDSVKGNKYFNSNRTATITIEEKNYDESYNSNTERFANKTVITLNGGRGPAVPKVSKFKHVGDKWIATVEFFADGDYQLAFFVRDDSGLTCVANAKNESKTFEGKFPRDFTIDKTAPTYNIYINNSKDETGRSYPAAPSVKVVMEDNNCESVSPTYTMSYIKGKDTPVTESMAVAKATNNRDHLKTLSSSDILFETDGYYVVTASVMDMAGNVTDGKSSVLIKNEYGAEYRLSDKLKKAVADMYVSSDAVKGSTEYFVDEYSLTEIKDEAVSYQLMAGGGALAKSGAVERIEVKDSYSNTHWYLYRYTIKFDDESLKLYTSDNYSLDIASSVNIGNKDIENHPAEAIEYIIDGVNPAVVIEGFEKQVLSWKKDYTAKINVTEKNLDYVFVSLLFNPESSDKKESYIFVSDPNALSEAIKEIISKNGIGKDHIFSLKDFKGNGTYDSVIDLASIFNYQDKKTMDFNIRIEVADKAGNKPQMYGETSDYFSDVTDKTTCIENVKGSGYIELKNVSVSKSISLKALFSEAHRNTTIAVCAAIAVLIAAAVFIPVFIKKRKKEDREEAALTE